MYINRLGFLVVLPALLVTLLLVGSGEVAAQITVFQTGFEYGSELDEPFIVEPKDLNGANGQVGLWSGDEFPEGQGDILFPPDAVGFADNPYGGRLMLLDRPTGDVDGTRPNAEPNSDFTGSYFADLDKKISLLGSEVTFNVGTRRTSGNQNKAYDIIGRDSNGAESFHVRVGTNNNGFERLGVITDGGNTVDFDLPTVVGNDRPEDLNNTGGGALPDVFGTGDEIGSVTVRLGANGYFIDFSHHPDHTDNSRHNAYTTDVISYNGNGADLAQIEFTYEASTANGRNSGYLLDNILVTGFEDLLLGDFNFDGNVNTADFQVMMSNFHTGTKFEQGDINFDAKINLHDFFEFKQVFQGQGQGATAAVPEPGSMALLAAGVLFLMGCRSRFSRMKG